mgnify:CR=1 FL=1
MDDDRERAQALTLLARALLAEGPPDMTGLKALAREIETLCPGALARIRDDLAMRSRSRTASLH